MSKENNTWIKLYRSIQSHWLWQDKPFSRGQAWVDLLMLAMHENSVFNAGNGRVIHGKRGTVYLSIKELASRWGWGRKKTASFLCDLENENMIRVHKRQGSHGTCLTIVNYDKFQSHGTSHGTRKSTREEHNQECIKNKESASTLSPYGDASALEESADAEDDNWEDPTTMTDDEKERWIHGDL